MHLPATLNVPSAVKHRRTYVGLDHVTGKVAGLGVPGLVLIIAMGATGYTGAAVLTAALAALGPGVCSAAL